MIRVPSLKCQGEAGPSLTRVRSATCQSIVAAINAAVMGHDGAPMPGREHGRFNLTATPAVRRLLGQAAVCNKVLKVRQLRAAPAPPSCACCTRSPSRRMSLHSLRRARLSWCALHATTLPAAGPARHMPASRFSRQRTLEAGAAGMQCPQVRPGLESPRPQGKSKALAGEAHCQHRSGLRAAAP